MSLDVDVQLLLKDAKTALLPVLRNITGWEQVSNVFRPSADRTQRQRLYDLLQATSESVTVSQISGAMTNLVYRCDYDTPVKVRLQCCKSGTQHMRLSC